MVRHKVIVNPVAGRGAAAHAIPTIEQLLEMYGLEYDLERTEHPWQAAEIAREAALRGYDVVVAAGGDGTSNEVLNGLMAAKQEGADCAMGVLCVGRGNDFAFGVNIPADLEAGVAALARGHRRTIDVGRVSKNGRSEGRYFGNGIGVGFDAVVGFEASKFARLGGFIGYLVGVFKALMLYDQAPTVSIEYDGKEIVQPALMVSVMNGRRMGGGFMMTPNSRPDDGQFDLCIADKVSRAGVLALIPHFIRGTQVDKKAITMGRSPTVTVRAVEGSLPAHADGETLCEEGESLAFEIVPQQIEVVVDEEGETE